MGVIKTNLIRSLNGRLGYLDKERDGSWTFYDKKRKPIWKNLKKWEIKEAIKNTVRKK